MLGHGILVERSHDFALKGSREGHAQVVFEPGAGEEITRDRCVQRIGGNLDAHRMENVLEHLVKLGRNQVGSALHLLGKKPPHPVPEVGIHRREIAWLRMPGRLVVVRLVEDEIEFHRTGQYHHPTLRFAQTIPLLSERIEHCNQVSDFPSNGVKVVSLNGEVPIGDRSCGTRRA